MTILPQPEKDVTDPLTELLRFGARELIAQAVETGLLDAHIGRPYRHRRAGMGVKSRIQDYSDGHSGDRHGQRLDFMSSTPDSNRLPGCQTMCVSLVETTEIGK